MLRRGKPSWWPADTSLPPPEGVARSEASWFGPDGRPCERDEATSVMVRHLDDAGGVVRSVWGHVVDGQPILTGDAADGPTVPAPTDPPSEGAPAPRRAPPPPPPPQPVPQAPAPPLLDRFASALSAGLPPGWFAKESITLMAPDGSGNVIFSSEPVDPWLTTEHYAEFQGDLLVREFPHFQQHDYRSAAIMGGRNGYVRRFSWVPPDGVLVHQTQLYWVDRGRGYTATATSPRPDFPELGWILDSLELVPREP